ncbi:nitrous oxide reductase family maturation protein NosD [Rhodohalobacter sp.]|uniref:nitrous oxide reductase family maturation protein NosD n=1 Tax=Rhodohalobacter sp. TaxID=1974210 RepID=UPI002ACD869F|nr:nitrous oxide reductase family maturation protein NosD [Rhodohalobacter sp.]
MFLLPLMAAAQSPSSDTESSELSELAMLIAKADSGDTVFLEPKTYAVNELLIEKPVTIDGQNGAVLDIGSEGFGLIVMGENITLQNFEIKDSGFGFMDDFAAILVEDSKNILIENLTLTNNFFAIFVAKSEKIEVSNNTIISNAERQTTSGNAVHIWYSKDVEVHQNEITGHRDGIYLEFVEGSMISGNIVYSNIRYGLHFMYSDDCSYIGNEFRDNISGVAVMYTDDVVMRHNRFIQNWGANRYGLLLKEINDSVVEYNIFEANSVGIYSEASNRVEIQSNEFYNNGTALRIMANGVDNRIERNNFIGNVFEVSTNSRINPNHYEGNYWSQYEGYDLDRDGVGDVEHRPVRLFSLFAERQPLSLIMLRSMMAGLLDTAERVFPVLTPKNLVDPKPAMNPIQ